jgi:hypothetical protein
MAKIVIIGHGDFDPGRESNPYPLQVLVPPNTTLDFYSDAGQTLKLPGRFLRGVPVGQAVDYTKVAEVWKQLTVHGNRVGPKGITHNFALHPDNYAEDREGALAADWGGATVEFTDSEPKYLCTDTIGECPTPELLHPDGAENRDLADPFETRFEHHCDGILGKWGQGGHELHWIACTAFTIVDPELPVLETATIGGFGATSSDSFEPYEPGKEWLYETEMEAIETRNRNNFPAGGSVAIVAGGKMVLIGHGHDMVATDYVRRQPDIEDGLLTVKPSPFQPGPTITVNGVEKKQDVFQLEIQRIAKRIYNIDDIEVKFKA